MGSVRRACNRSVSHHENPKTVILGRDQIKIGLCENGGDPSQEGCFFEVDDVEAAFADLKARGPWKTFEPERQLLITSLSRRGYENALPTDWNEDVFVSRIDGHGVAREEDVRHKLLSSSVDYGHSSLCRVSREVVVVGPRIVPDLVGI